MSPHNPNKADGYGKNRQAWFAAKAKNPCDRCGEVSENWHHATCFGENICHECYKEKPTCLQVYPGDLGGAPFFGPISQITSG